MPDERILNADVYITLPASVSPANYFINEIYNLFPCNIASSNHLGIRENTRVALGNHSASPRASQRYSCSHNFPRV